jgi:rubrerythrin
MSSKACIREMIQTAKAEGNKEAERSFNFANEVEKIHAGLYQQMLDNLEGGERILQLLRLPCMRLYRGERSARNLSGVRR